MVITFPKQSEAMVTLFHGEGNFPFSFWYTLTKPLELQEISVKLLNAVFYSVKQNINKSIWRWEYCYCSLQCSYSVTCRSFYVNWASTDKIWTILHTGSYVVVFVVCQLSWEVLKVVPWTFHLKTTHEIQTDLDHVLTIKNLNFMISPYIRIWLCISGFLLLCAWSMLGNGEIIANLDKICSLNNGWVGFVFNWKRGEIGILSVLWMSFIACKYL